MVHYSGHFVPVSGSLLLIPRQVRRYAYTGGVNDWQVTLAPCVALCDRQAKRSVKGECACA